MDSCRSVSSITIFNIFYPGGSSPIILAPWLVNPPGHERCFHVVATSDTAFPTAASLSGIIRWKSVFNRLPQFILLALWLEKVFSLYSTTQTAQSSA
jgi:hypothetical protein